VMVQCVVHHELVGENQSLSFHIPVTTLCQQFVDDIAALLSCSTDRLSVYYERHSLLDSIDKVIVDIVVEFFVQQFTVTLMIKELSYSTVNRLCFTSLKDYIIYCH